MPSINVSEETYQKLQERAIPFQDREPEDVIVRLLLNSGRLTISDLPEQRLVGRDLVSHAGRIPHGSRLRASYKGIEFDAEISDGQIIWDGHHFDSVSQAAVAVIQSTGSRRPTENGWRFWEVQAPGNCSWVPATRFQNRSPLQNGSE